MVRVGVIIPCIGASFFGKATGRQDQLSLISSNKMEKLVAGIGRMAW